MTETGGKGISFQAAHLNEHFDARDPLERQQQEGHERQPLALRRLLEAVDDGGEIQVVFPAGEPTQALSVPRSRERKAEPLRPYMSEVKVFSW